MHGTTNSLQPHIHLYLLDVLRGRIHLKRHVSTDGTEKNVKLGT